MRSSVPFNIASYALLTCMIAHVTGLETGDLVHVIGDAHIYLNHQEALKEQLKRKPLPFPRVKLDESVTDITEFRFEHFKLHDYKCHKAIKMEMAV